MSGRRGDEPAPIVQRLVRQVGVDDAPPAELARRVEEAVRAGVVVEFVDDHPVGPFKPAFRVQLGRGVLHVVDHRGRHVGTFASAAAAIAHGWAAEIDGRRFQRVAAAYARGVETGAGRVDGVLIRVADR